MNETQLSKSVKKMQKDINKLNAKMAEHAGDIGETTHGIPSNGEAGFMPFNLYKGSHQLFEKREWVTGINVNDLQPGFYYCANMLGIPEDAELEAMATIDVTVYEENRKEIVFTQGMLNRTWKKMLHAPSANPSDRGWFRIMTSKVLWQGALQAVGQPQTLAEPINRFREIEIFFQTTAGNLCYTKFDSGHRLCTLEAGNIPGAGGVESITSVEADLDLRDVSKFNITSNHSIILTESSVGEANVELIIKQINGVL
ncbi:hypothetical protein [Latilactobacillus curvatus]|uniref:hypothetical protein n=1 Tax=Latilactobacillus curvatus TaxID=28038 RepID=UPI00240ECF4F|nr:hypothetical protein [Latilactobacillus curvatus]MDG2980315.1 hypothetical protein [Latilactobacillus curvatus]WCZ54970.1 hypothetical protein [Latilactobacillus phage TMW 1.1365 P1]